MPRLAFRPSAPAIRSSLVYRPCAFNFRTDPIIPRKLFVVLCTPRPHNPSASSCQQELLIPNRSAYTSTMLTLRAVSAPARRQCFRAAPRVGATLSQASCLPPTFAAPLPANNRTEILLLREGRQVHRSQGCQRTLALSIAPPLCHDRHRNVNHSVGVDCIESARDR